jgi:hypothetical protein
VQSTEEPATQIQEELVIWMLICSRSWNGIETTWWERIRSQLKILM